MSSFHIPVLLKEIIEGLGIEKDSLYVDATLGGGGYAFEILKRGGKVLGIDVDKDALGYVEKRWDEESKKLDINEGGLILARGNFRDIAEIAHLKHFDRVKGITFDLGVSSYQLETGQRGFSFQKTGPLDMRMDQDLGVTAKDLLRALSKKELYELFLNLGEEKNARFIAEKIVKVREIKPIETTADLVSLIEESTPKKFGEIHKATRIFQALRIAVNDELNSLQEALPKAINLLERDGKILVVSFHSLEDRIVKKTFLRLEAEGMGKIVTDKPIVPKDDEIRMNKRARSAKLRIFRKI